MIPRIFIIDDEAPARARMTTLLSDIAAECPHSLVGESGHPQEALDAITDIKPNIILLDVQMPGMTGIEFATHLSGNMAEAPAVIFISAYDQYALKAFEVHALDYLLKPVRAARLAEAIRRVSVLRKDPHAQQEQLASAATALQSKRLHFSVQVGSRVLLVPATDVVYLRAEAKYVTLRTRSRDYLIEESLSSIEQELAEVFVRVHRNALVARNAIIGVKRGLPDSREKGMDNWQVILKDIDERLPISRRQWPVIKALVK